MINRTLLYGEGLFETIRWKPSEEKLRLHYKRLSSSALALGIPCPEYEEFVEDIKKEAGTREKLYIKYLLISKGGDLLTESPESYGSLIITKPLRPAPERVKLCISTYRRHSSDPLSRHKTTSYMFNLLVKREAQSKGFWDAIIVNEDRYICETSTANLLLVRGSQFYTPARTCGLLYGTTLEFLSKRVDIKEDYIRPEELERFDGVFLLNSLILCSLVEELEGMSLRTDHKAFQEVSRILSNCL